MAPGKVIRIDSDVWNRLQALAEPLEDNANSVLRRVLGLQAKENSENIESRNSKDTRIIQLISLVKEITGVEPNVHETKTGQYSFKSKRDKVISFLVPQRKRLIIAVKYEIAEKAGLSNWDHLTKGGWYATDDQVEYWILNNDEKEYMQKAKMLAKLWKLYF